MIDRDSLSLSLQFADARHRRHLPRHRVARWLRAALQAPAELAVRIVDADEGQALNRDYRGRDYATNVLTFAYDGTDPLVGDIALCVPVILAEAQAAGRAPEAHFAHLVVHGMLHLQGYDHEDDAAAAAMEGREAQILGDLGYPDPYLPAA